MDRSWINPGATNFQFCFRTYKHINRSMHFHLKAKTIYFLYPYKIKEWDLVIWNAGVGITGAWKASHLPHIFFAEDLHMCQVLGKVWSRKKKKKHINTRKIYSCDGAKHVWLHYWYKMMQQSVQSFTNVHFFINIDRHKDTKSNFVSDILEHKFCLCLTVL